MGHGYHLGAAPCRIYLPGGGDGRVQSLRVGLGDIDHNGGGVFLAALEQALGRAQPAIFNRDPGSPFTSLEFTGRLEVAGIRISMDGRGRALDNVFVERLWRTVKQEEVYLKDDRTPREATQELERFFVRYNERRQHQSLNDRTLAAVYFGTGEPDIILS